jgi:hypothetical protein
MLSGKYAILCFNEGMRARNLMLLLWMGLSVLAAACTATVGEAPQAVEPEIIPTVTLAATTAPATSTPALPATKTPRTPPDMSGYAIQFNGQECPLQEVEFYNLYVFQAACGETVYIPQGTTISMTFITPDGQPLPIAPIAEIESIFGALEPPFLFCQFGGVDDSNTITFGVPFQQNTGREILCGFSIPLQGREVIITLAGLTTRAF